MKQSIFLALVTLRPTFTTEYKGARSGTLSRRSSDDRPTRFTCTVVPLELDSKSPQAPSVPTPPGCTCNEDTGQGPCTKGRGTEGNAEPNLDTH